MDSPIIGRFVSAIVPGDFMLGTKLGKWYERNPYHKYHKGDILILRNRRIVGFGVRPVMVVNGYEVREGMFGREGNYDTTSYIDSKGNFLQWMKQNEIPRGVERTIDEHQKHFKWNLEYHFKKVPVSSVEQALALYRSKEVEPQTIVA